MAEKIKIHEWDMGIYPRKLWVCKTKTPLALKEYFYNESGAELNDNQQFDGLAGFVMKAIKKETMDIGYVVCFMRNPDTCTIAHEATHVSLLMCDDVGLEVINGSDNEHIAYLCGWVADKIWQVVTNKIK